MSKKTIALFIFTLIFIPPVSIYILWRHSTIGKDLKIGLTVLGCLMSIWFLLRVGDNDKPKQAPKSTLPTTTTKTTKTQKEKKEKVIFKPTDENIELFNERVALILETGADVLESVTPELSDTGYIKIIVKNNIWYNSREDLKMTVAKTTSKLLIDAILGYNMVSDKYLFTIIEYKDSNGVIVAETGSTGTTKIIK
jgi:hypothetical protein